MPTIKEQAKKLKIRLTIKKNGKRQKKSNELLKKQINNKKTNTSSKKGKGWSSISKKIDRTKMRKSCFVDPKNKKYIICNQRGIIDCAGIQSAVLRSRILYGQYNKSEYKQILNKAKKLLKSKKCNKV